MDESKVEELLDTAVADGAIVYEKPRDDKSLKRDLFAHAALYRDGWEFTVVAENRMHKNIDLILRDGQYWEIKSPVSKGDGNDPTAFVEERLQEARHQFRGHPSTEESETRVVLNCRYTDVPDEDITMRIKKEMRKQGIVEVVQVFKDGTVRRFRQK